jgi:transcriptional regulator with XRE-family HTH domain
MSKDRFRRTKGPPSQYLPNLCVTRIAESLELHPSYLIGVLAGRRNPTLETADRIAQAMGWSLNQVRALRHGTIPKRSRFGPTGQ